MELLLLSNSTLPGKAWLEHALPLIANQLNGRRSAVFIPFAGVTRLRVWLSITAVNVNMRLFPRASPIKSHNEMRTVLS